MDQKTISLGNLLCGTGSGNTSRHNSNTLPHWPRNSSVNLNLTQTFATVKLRRNAEKMKAAQVALARNSNVQLTPRSRSRSRSRSALQCLARNYDPDEDDEDEDSDCYTSLNTSTLSTKSTRSGLFKRTTPTHGSFTFSIR